MSAVVLGINVEHIVAKALEMHVSN